MPLAEIEKLQGIGKAIAGKIEEARQTGIFHQLQEALETIPSGVIEMMQIDGLGVKKVKTLWQEHGIEDTDQLLQACENDQIASLKGFGKKTQENILQSLLFMKAASDKVHFATAEAQAKNLEAYLQDCAQITSFQTVGQVRRKAEVVDLIAVIIATQDQDAVFAHLDQCDFLQKNEKSTGLFAWRGFFVENSLKVELRCTLPEQYYTEIFLNTGVQAHLAFREDTQEKTLLQHALSDHFESEAAIYEKANLPYIAPELREGQQEFVWAQASTLPQLLEVSQIKGILHAHSTYSDGKNTLEEMAKACQEAGYEYLGITDHSQSAFYANGLYEHQVKKQHQEIDALNQKLSPFKIFKGIEADILADGRLDYEDRVLDTFDFVIASVHSSLKMSQEKATERLIKAIEHPYTTILGHPSGRLLLRREGYALNYAKVIDACAANQVAIEVNANPWRLDLPWSWLPYALEKGVKICINPDAHRKEAIQDVYYGVCVARKGGLQADMTLNTWGREAIDQFFQARKPQTTS